MQTSKEKQMQAERKRRAAMFISMLKATPATADAAPTAKPETVPVTAGPAEG